MLDRRFEPLLSMLFHNLRSQMTTRFRGVFSQFYDVVSITIKLTHPITLNLTHPI